MNEVIKLAHLRKVFGSTEAVKDLSLDIHKGEIYGFLGPNGAGKTTTIKMMTGLYRPTSGSVNIGGTDLEREPEKAKALFGYIPDEPFVYERMTGREFLYLVGALYRISREETAERIEALASLFPLEGILDEYAENYSRGNKQKLTIIAAFLPKPLILVVDEPIVGLDPESAMSVRTIFKNFVVEGGTVFMATHTLSFAEIVCTRVGILKKGSLIAEGTIPELKTRAHAESKSLEDLYLALTK